MPTRLLPLLTAFTIALRCVLHLTVHLMHAQDTLSSEMQAADGQPSSRAGHPEADSTATSSQHDTALPHLSCDACADDSVDDDNFLQELFRCPITQVYSCCTRKMSVALDFGSGYPLQSQNKLSSNYLSIEHCASKAAGYVIGYSD